MILSENRYPRFRIMLEKTVAKDILLVKAMGRTNGMR